MTDSLTEREIASQPTTWALALAGGASARTVLAAPGERMLVIGCGTSAFVSQSLAALRERAGLGETHWAYASELPVGRTYDRVVALTRSGTTTEVLEAMAALRGTARLAAVCGVAGMPVEDLADDVILLDYADEQSVVQTRFPTTVLVLARAAFGEDVAHLPEQCARVLAAPPGLPVPEFEHFVYLGRDWTVGLAHESALKIREAAQAWAESYPALDYRHGPIAVAGPRSLVWMHGPMPDGLADDVRAVGATVVVPDVDPLVSLALAQRGGRRSRHRARPRSAPPTAPDPQRRPRRLRRSTCSRTTTFDRC